MQTANYTFSNVQSLLSIFFAFSDTAPSGSQWNPCKERRYMFRNFDYE